MTFCPLIKDECKEERCAFYSDVDETEKAAGFGGVCVLACATENLEYFLSEASMSDIFTSLQDIKIGIAGICERLRG